MRKKKNMGEKNDDSITKLILRQNPSLKLLLQFPKDFKKVSVLSLISKNKQSGKV